MIFPLTATRRGAADLDIARIRLQAPVSVTCPACPECVGRCCTTKAMSNLLTRAFGLPVVLYVRSSIAGGGNAAKANHENLKDSHDASKARVRSLCRHESVVGCIIVVIVICLDGKRMRPMCPGPCLNLMSTTSPPYSLAPCFIQHCTFDMLTEL